MCREIAFWQLLAICLVLTWAGQKSVNGDPVAANRPIWYNGPISTSLVYQRAVNSAAQQVYGESRAFPSPVFYANSILTSSATPPVPSGPLTKTTSTTTTTSTTESPPKSAKKYDVFKFFEKLKRINEKYANPNVSFGTQKQLNEDTAEESNNSRVDFIRSEEGQMDNEDDDDGDDESSKEADSPINEGRKKLHHGLIKIKHKGKKKISKLLYPILVGLVTAKSIIIPLFFKAVVVLSKFSFFVSTLSFIISSILGIKVLLLSNNNSRRSNDNTRVEVVHVPLQQKYPTTYSSSSSGWIDRESENKFIPIQQGGASGGQLVAAETERIIYEKPYSEQEKGLEKDSYLPL